MTPLQLPLFDPDEWTDETRDAAISMLDAWLEAHR
jgi:hypothetical protein